MCSLYSARFCMCHVFCTPPCANTLVFSYWTIWQLTYVSSILPFASELVHSPVYHLPEILYGWCTLCTLPFVNEFEHAVFSVLLHLTTNFICLVLCTPPLDNKPVFVLFSVYVLLHLTTNVCAMFCVLLHLTTNVCVMFFVLLDLYCSIWQQVCVFCVLYSSTWQQLCVSCFLYSSI